MCRALTSKCENMTGGRAEIVSLAIVDFAVSGTNVPPSLSGHSERAGPSRHKVALTLRPAKRMTAIAPSLDVELMMRQAPVMRTTVDLPEHIILEARRIASARKTSLSRTIEYDLRKYLADERTKRVSRRPSRSLPHIDAGLPRSGRDLDDTSALWELC